MTRIVLFFLVVVMSASFCCADNDLGSDYSRSHSRGYWFYDDPEPPVEQKPAQAKEQPPTKVDLSPPKKNTPIKKADPPVELTVEWLQANMKKFMYDAMDHPDDPDKVRAWLYMQRLMMDKSQRFADATQRALITDPFLDENTRRPIASFGGAQANREAESVMNSLFKRLSSRVGLWFFFRSDEIGMNDIQAGVLEMFSNETGITVQAISMDGSSLPNGHYPDAKVDQGQSKVLDISQTPALFIVNPTTNEVMPLSQATLALPDLKKRVLVAAASVEWISEDDFQKTRGMRSELTLDSTPVVPQSTLDDPKEIADKFKRLLEQRAKNAL